jgi:protein-disulfide isomerase
MKIFSLAAFCLIFLSSPALSFEKKALEINLRKSLNLTTKQKIEVGDPQPSEFAGLKKVQITIDGAPYPVYLADDGKHYFWGQVMNMSIDPDKMRAEKISLNKVRSRGSSRAPVILVEYTDLQCPHCKRAHKKLKESLHKDYKESQVRVVFKHFPLSMHKWAEEASVASECAALQNEKFFWDMIDYYFDHQEHLTPENIGSKTAEMAAKLKLDRNKFNQCMAAKETLPKVTADRNEGASIGVGGTPSYFVNGRMLRGTDYEDLKLLINEKLESGK